MTTFCHRALRRLDGAANPAEAPAPPALERFRR